MQMGENLIENSEIIRAEGFPIQHRYSPTRRGVRFTTGVPTPAILGVDDTLLAARTRSSFSACALANSSLRSISAFDSVTNA